MADTKDPPADTTDAEVATEATKPGVTETTEDTTEDTTEGTEQTFAKEYVDKIRREAQGLRDRAKTAETRVDELSRALFTARAAATGKLVDASALAFDPALDDGDKISAAVDSLLESKPYLRSRVPSGNVGQGAKDARQPTSLLSHLKSLV